MNKTLKYFGAAAFSAVLLAGAVGTRSVTADTTPMPQLAGLPSSFADLVETVRPAVVNIAVESQAGAPTLPGAQQPFRGDPRMEEFFRRFFNEGNPQTAPAPRQARAVGSGFIVDADGYVVTNHHVIDDATKVTVILDDGTELNAEVRGSDPKSDIALLKVESKQPLPFVTFGNSDRARVGDWVIAIGNPFGLGGTTTTGIISARGRDINSGPLDDFIQVDAAINRGNSGGPLFATDGSVIGVNTAIYSPNGGSVGIGFAVPAEQASRVIAQLRDNGSVTRGWLGVQIQSLNEDLASSLGLDSPDGALVAAVVPDSPAERAGIETGDVIMTFDGRSIAKMRELPKAVARTAPDREVTVGVIRDGRKQDIPVTLARSQDEQPVAAVNNAGNDALGMTVARLNQSLRERFGIDDKVTGVVVVDVDPQSKAADKGIRPGDVISRIGRMAVTDPDNLREGLEQARENARPSVLLRVGRDGNERFLAIPIA